MINLMADTALFGLDLKLDPNNTTRTLLLIYQPSLLLPVGNYLNKDAESKAALKVYELYLMEVSKPI